MRGIHRWPVNSPKIGQWRRALVFSLICAWTHGWDAGDLRCHRTHYDVTVMRQVYDHTCFEYGSCGTRFNWIEKLGYIRKYFRKYINFRNRSGSHLNIKTLLSRIGVTIMNPRPFYLCNGNSCTGKNTCLNWDGPLSFASCQTPKSVSICLKDVMPRMGVCFSRAIQGMRYNN